MMNLTSYQWIGLVFAAVGVFTLLVTFIESKKNKSLHLDNLPVSRIFTLVTRLLVGTLFIYSGFVKANDYIGFAYKLDEYFTVFAQHFPPLASFFEFFIPWAEPMAWFISIFEISLGVALILGWQANIVIWLSMLMMIFFTVLTGYSHVTGAVTDCGCFGDALKLAPWESFVKDLILMLTLIPLFWIRKSIKPIPNGKIAMIVTLITFIISGAYSYYCHEYLPIVDYRPYKLGVDLEECTTVPGPEGFPKCKDWDILFRGVEEPELFSDTKLLIVAYDLEKANKEALKSSSDLENTLERSGEVEVVGLTASFGETIENARQTYNITYPFGLADATVLKTIIRSNPGYVLLKDGVIMKKWHHNNIPSETEIQSYLR